jgi:hypothetical protein
MTSTPVESQRNVGRGVLVALSIIVLSVLGQAFGKILGWMAGAWFPEWFREICQMALLALAAGSMLYIACLHTVRAVTWLTWKAALRFRLFWVLAALLVLAVVGLPLVLKDDGTARGFTQILLTYTLGSVTALLGIATLWLSSGTLARDIEENQMQLVAVKPIARWQVWLGKWLGIVSLDAVLLVLAGVCIGGLLQWRAGKLPPEQRKILRNEVLVARASLKEKPVDIEEITDRIFKEQTKQTQLSPNSQALVRNQIRDQVKARFQVVQPNHARFWEIEMGPRRFTLKDEPLFLRLKFNAASTNALGTYITEIHIGPVDSPKQRITRRSLAADTFHEIEIPPNLWDEKGILRVEVRNYDHVALLFPLEDGFEVLFREGGFALNFSRGLFIILCWLSLLAAVGLAAASFLSFPVAVFCSVTLLIVGFSTGTLASAVETGSVGGMNEETGEVHQSVLDWLLIPAFKGLLGIFEMIQQFSPVDALSTGRSIPWSDVLKAFGEIVLLLGGMIALFGMFVFTRRELARNQSNV